MIKVMVTGSTGVLGKRLVASLHKSVDEVVSFFGDITDIETIRSNISEHSDITHLFHLAAVVPTDAVEQNFVRALNVNAYGTGLLLSSLIEADLKPWFCYVSSSHVYEPSEALLREDSPCSPSSAYGLTKYLGEMNLKGLSNLYNGSLTVARVFSYYDELQVGSFLYPAWMRKVNIWDGETQLKVFGGESIRDFSHSLEVVGQLEDLLRYGFSGTINLGSGRPKKVIDFLREQLGDHYPFESTGSSNSIIPDVTKINLLRGEYIDQIS